MNVKTAIITESHELSRGLLKPREVVDDLSPFGELPDALDRVSSRSSLKEAIRRA